jgi:hypothetical protein
VHFHKPLYVLKYIFICLTVMLMLGVFSLSPLALERDTGIVADGALRPLIMTSELVIGQNRFTFGLLRKGRLLEGANTVVKLYAIEGQEAQLEAELKVPFYSLELTGEKRVAHHHPDATPHEHSKETDVRGFYATPIHFPRPGPWGLEVGVRHEDGSVETVRLAVTVLAAPSTPSVGQLAPRSRNLIAADVQSLHQIDTSEVPDPRLHQVRISDAIDQGKPQIIVFATPQFCTSRMCSSVVDIVRTLVPVYDDRVVFTHQEIWHDFAAKRVFDTVREWQLSSEPWIFVVDGQGIIRAKFEGLVTARELESALQQTLTPKPSRRP